MVILRDNASKSKSASLKLEKIQAQCIEELECLIEARTKRYKNFANYDDLCQDGRIALYRAMQTYKPEKGDFFWWANHYIKTKISREANCHSTIKVPLKKANKIHPYKVSKIPMIVDDANTALENISKDETVSIIRNAVENLPEEQRKVISLHYELNGGADNKRELCSIGKICDTLNISIKNCVRLLSEAKRNLRRELVEVI